MNVRTATLLVIFLLTGSSGMAQGNSEIRKVSQSNPIKLTKNNILVNSSVSRTSGSPKTLLKPTQSISISSSILSEVGTAFKSLYNIQNQLVSLKVGNSKTKILDLKSHVGVKGWEAKAVGSFSKKRPSTFDLNYRFSLEDMVVSGHGHRLMLITKF